MLGEPIDERQKSDTPLISSILDIIYRVWGLGRRRLYKIVWGLEGLHRVYVGLRCLGC